MSISIQAAMSRSSLRQRCRERLSHQAEVLQECLRVRWCIARGAHRPSAVHRRLFSSARVKIAVWKSIHREDNKPAIEKPISQSCNSIRIIDNFLRGARTEPQSNRHQSNWFYELSNSRCMTIECFERCGKRGAAVHICAVTKNKWIHRISVANLCARAASINRAMIASPIIGSFVLSGCHCTPR